MWKRVWVEVRRIATRIALPAGLIVLFGGLAVVGVIAKSDWSMFVPELIVGAATGLLVGGVLAVSQRNTSQAAERSAHQLTWLEMRPRVAAAISQADFVPSRYSNGIEMNAFIRKLDPVLAQLDNQPIRLWSETLTYEELGLLASIKETKPRIETELLEAKNRIRTAFAPGANTTQNAVKFACEYLMGTVPREHTITSSRDEQAYEIAKATMSEVYFRKLSAEVAGLFADVAKAKALLEQSAMGGIRT